MSSFSWLKADVSVNKVNIAFGDRFACLIPEEFGGGFIESHYRNHGYLDVKEDGSPRYNMYELLALWNKERFANNSIRCNGDFQFIKEIDNNTPYNEKLGMSIGSNDVDIDKLKFPLKLVDPEYAKNHTYEECEYRSYIDTEKGLYSYKWEALPKIRTCFYDKPQVSIGYLKYLKGRLNYLQNSGLYKENSCDEIEILEKFINTCTVINWNIITY